MDFSVITDENRIRNIMKNGPDHPVNAAHRAWIELRDRSPESVQVFDEFHHAKILRFVLDHIEFVPVCMDLHKPKKETTCSCLPDLVTDLTDLELKACATSLLTFAKQEKEQQQIRVMDWIAHDAALERGLLGCGRILKHKRVVLPGTCNELICKNRLSALIGYGKKKWGACAKLVKENKTPCHGLLGKESNNNQKNRGYKGILEMYFQEILLLAVPRATRIVRNTIRQAEATNETATLRVELRDDDVELLELPSSMSKRGLYARFLSDYVGIVQVLDSKGRVVGVHRKEEDSSSAVPDIYPSWRSFNRHWERYHKKLVVAKPREDVCDDCWTYANSFRFKKRTSETEEEGTEEVSHEEQEAQQRNNESVIKAAAAHVEQAELQRQLFNAKIEEAKASRFYKREEQTVTWVIDYAQNMSVPQFGSEQPGKTYYLCPMNFYVFGIVDCVTDCLLAQVYGEDVAGKGGNCVASMLYDQVEKALLPRPCETNTAPIKELNIIMDNCGGQNKNRMVMRLLHVIVLRKIASKVNAIFLVKGHTKNPCDRKFNELKKDTRDDNIYTPPMLFEALNKQHMVTAQDFDRFFDWDAWQSKFMRPTIPKIKSFHVFTVDANYKDGCVMSRYANDGAERDDCIMIHGKHKEKMDWISTSPDRLDRVGMTDIKHVELYDKWRPLIPQHHWKDLRYFHEEPTQAKRKQVQQERGSSKKARANRQREENTDTALQPVETSQPQATGPSPTH